jgi:hypothetical protein
MKEQLTITNNGNYVAENNGTLIQNFFEGPPIPPQPPIRSLDEDPPQSPRPRFWLELDRIQHIMALAAALAMLTLVVLCCWPTQQTVPAVMPLIVVLGMVGTVGFSYFYYTESAFK